MSSAEIAPILKYPGSKWRLARWIIDHLPPHTTYLEPFFGSGAVFLRKPRSPLEVINDLDGQVVNLFRVCRERPGDLAAAAALTPWAREEHRHCWEEPFTGDPLEDARRFLARCWQNYGGRVQRSGGWRHSTGLQTPTSDGGMQNPVRQWQQLPERILATAARLQDAQIEHRPAIELIGQYRRNDVAIYADPPYVWETRGNRFDRHYGCEMADADHRALLDVLDAHPGPVLLSGYRCVLYDDRLRGWGRRTRKALAEGGQAREEVLWLSPVAVAALERGRLFSLQEVSRHDCH